MPIPLCLNRSALVASSFCVPGVVEASDVESGGPGSGPVVKKTSLSSVPPHKLDFGPFEEQLLGEVVRLLCKLTTPIECLVCVEDLIKTKEGGLTLRYTQSSYFLKHSSF